MEAVKKCRAPEFGISCNTELKPKNKSGFCGKHFYYSKKDPKDYEPLKDPAPASGKSERKPGPQQTNGHAVTSNGREHNLIDVRVSEFHLDRLWSRMSVEEKARALFPRETEPAHA